MLFQVERITSERVKDARLVPSVMVRLTDDAKLDDIQEKAADDQDQVLLLLDTTPGKSQADMAKDLGWTSEFGPDKAKVNRSLTNLVKRKLAEKDERGKYNLTDKGKKKATKLRE